MLAAVRLYVTESQFSTQLYSSEVSVRLNTTTAAMAQSEAWDGWQQPPVLTASWLDAEPPALVEVWTPFAR